MKQKIAAVTIVVSNYDEALDFYVGKLGFELVEDTQLTPDKRWVLVFLFLQTNDFDRDHDAYLSRGVNFLEEPRNEAYGKVAVFQDPFGNRWDLVEYH